jgi:anti-sigma factor RsiW
MSNRIPAELTCQQLVELVTDYLEERLSPEERLRFEQHLHYCDGCAEFLAQMRGTVALSKGHVEEQLSPALEAELLRAFRSWKKG